MITIGNIVDFLQAENSLYQLEEKVIDVSIERPAAITDAQPGDVSFCGATAKDPQEFLSKTKASLLMVDRNISIDEKALARANIKAVILSDNARLDFMRVVKHFFASPGPTGIHPSAVIAHSAVIASDVFVGPLCTIGEKVEIGEDTVIHSGVHIYDGVRIGRKVTIGSGTVIGAEGFGYERNSLGELEKFPHIGMVQIGDNVDIGSNVSIDRGTLGKTVIGEGCKINNATHIAHNVEIGENTIIMAQVYLGGSLKVGKQCWIGPRATIRDRIQIGSDVFVGMGSVVTKNIPNRVTVMGAPARKIQDQKKLLTHWALVIAQTDQMRELRDVQKAPG